MKKEIPELSPQTQPQNHLLSPTKQKIEPWRKNLYVIWIAQFISMMGMNIVVPFLPFFVRVLGVTNPSDVAKWSGYAYSGPFVLSFFLIPVWGMLADRYGQKLMVVRAIFGLAISQALIGFSLNVEMLVLFRIVQGGISGFIAAAMALVASSAPENKSGYALGVLQTSTALGAVIGPFVGGALADMVGYRPLFFIVAVLCTLAGFLVVFYAKEAPKHHLEEAEHHTLIDNYRYAFKSHHIRTVLVLIAISGIAITFSQPIFALYVDMLETNKKFLATIAGAIFSVAGLFMVISAPWWGKQNDIKGFKKNLTIAVSGAALSFSAQAFVTSSFQLVLLRAIQGFCVGGILPVLYSQINIHSERSRKGGIMGIASSFNILANIFGPSTGGFIAATLGLRMNFFLSGVFLLAALVLIRLFIVERISGMVEPQQIATVVAEEPL